MNNFCRSLLQFVHQSLHEARFLSFYQNVINIRDYVTFGYLLSQIRLSVVFNVHAPWSVR